MLKLTKKAESGNAALKDLCVAGLIGHEVKMSGQAAQEVLIYGYPDKALQGLNYSPEPGELVDGFYRTDGGGTALVWLRGGQYYVCVYRKGEGRLHKVRESGPFEDRQNAGYHATDEELHLPV